MPLVQRLTVLVSVVQVGKVKNVRKEFAKMVSGEKIVPRFANAIKITQNSVIHGLVIVSVKPAGTVKLVVELVRYILMGKAVRNIAIARTMLNVLR